MKTTCTIQVIAPCGWASAEAVRRGVERLSAYGQVIGSESAARRYLRFAGTDAERAADINRLADAETPLPDVVMALRGGYGLSRLLDRLDYAGLRQRLSGQPCAIVGHSDVTALSLALLAQARLITFAGPMLAPDFGAPELSDFTVDEFWSVLRQPSHTLRWQTHGQTHAVPLDVRGTLWGGNLSMLCSLIGTPYLPVEAHGILFVEDVGEPLYRIERMLYQLHYAGVLAHQKALVLGDFTGFNADTYRSAYDYDYLVAHIRDTFGIAVVTGLPFGHGPDKTTLPIGAHGRLRVASSGQVELSYHGYPHLSALP